jgi:hypothetical protein
MLPASEIACCVLSVILAATACSARANVIRCPDRLALHRFDTAEVYDGLPSEGDSRHPVRGGWDLSRGAFSPEGLFLVCRYRGTNETTVTHLPTKVKYCMLDISNKTVVNVTCK